MRTLLAILVPLALCLPAGAAECVPTTSDPELDAMGFYFDNDLCQFDEGDGGGGYGGGGPCLFSMWFYQESNGIPGLQRGDEVVDDTCRGQIEADTIFFY